MTKAILFGSIGVLAETSELQRAAFNEAFAEADLSWHWSPSEYEMMLGQNGGEQRIRTYGHVQGVSVDAAQLHKRKSEIYRSKLARGIAPRPEIDTVVRAAMGMNLRLGFVTTTSRANVDAVLDALPDDLHVEIFDFVGDRDMVEHGKPARDIYDLALQKLGIDAVDAIAVEDSPSSAKAAVAAGIPTIAFPGRAHAHRVFQGVEAKVEVLTPELFGLGRAIGSDTLQAAIA